MANKEVGLGQISYLVKALKNNKKLSEVFEIKFDDFADKKLEEKKYKFLLALLFNNKTNDLLEELGKYCTRKLN